MEPAKTTNRPQLSRQEVLEGLSGRTAKQASTLLTLIENRTAQRRAESHQAARYTPAMTSAERAQSYLEALAQGRDRTYQPTIRDLERYAPQWAELAPENPTLRAMVAHLLGANHRFTPRVTPGIRLALGLDKPSVQTAYQQQYAQPLHTIYALRLTPAEQIRWGWVALAGRLENLSPFWTAFALTLTETVGAGILALPIALAGVGPLAGLILLLSFGLLNTLTLAGVTEAITRNGNFRYGVTYFGRLLDDYLGPIASLTFSLGLLLVILFLLLGYYIGLATTLAAATGVPAIAWACLLFVVTLYVLRRRSLDTTVASALVIGFVNIALILLLILLTLPHVTRPNLTYLRVPFFQGQAWDPSLLGLIFGTVLTAYFGHTAVGNMAKTVLRRDPSGRTLLWGNVAALLTASLLYSLWVLVVNGAIAPTTMAQTSGTALIPLASVVGPSVHLFGTLFAVLGMGMASLHYSMALFNQVQEWFSTIGRPRHGWQVRFHRRGGRAWLGMLPIGGVFLFTLWLLLTNRESFAGAIGFIGAIGMPLMAGTFPILLLVASRRMGEYVPVVIWRWLGHPVVAGLLYLIFFAGLLAHGLFIWSDPIQRGVALLVSVGMLVLTGLILRRGKLAPRTVIEVRILAGLADSARVQVVSHGRSLATKLQINRQKSKKEMQTAQGALIKLRQLESLHIHLPASAGPTLKIWIHRLLAEGASIGLPARVTVSGSGINVPIVSTTDPTHGQLVLRLPGAPCQVEIILEKLDGTRNNG